MLISRRNSSSRKRPAACRGVTLLEMMIAMASGAVILGSMLCTAVTVSNTTFAIGNYCDLNQASRNTLDTMSQDLRNTATVTAVTNSQLTVSNALTGDVITYSWDGSNALVRTFNQAKTVMLTQCDYLRFNNYQRNPTNNFQFLPASTPAETKLVSVSWRCSRKILGAKINTESVQTAQICIRN